MKSVSTAGTTAAAETVTVVSSLDGRESEAVIAIAAPSFSSVAVFESVSVTAGGGSSSSMVRTASSESMAPWVFTAMPETATCLSGASVSLFRAMIVTVPVLAVCPSAMVSVAPVSVKSPATAGSTAATETVTVVGLLDRRSRVAVTVVEPPFSPIESGVNTIVTTGAGSSSVIVNRTPSGGTIP